MVLDIVYHNSPFAATEPPPPPAVVLLIQTDLDEPASADLLIHEDFGLAPKAKSVKFAHTYPPPRMFDKLIPSPGGLSRRNLDKTAEWKKDHTKEDTVLVKAVVHQIVDRVLDTTKAISFQKGELLEQVYREAAVLYPILRQYDENWVTYCIVYAHLKYTSTEAAKKAAQERVETLETAITAVQSGPGPRTRTLRGANKRSVLCTAFNRRVALPLQIRCLVWSHDMDSHYNSPSPSSKTPNYFDGHILNHLGVFGVHYGNHSFLHHIHSLRIGEILCKACIVLALHRTEVCNPFFSVFAFVFELSVARCTTGTAGGLPIACNASECARLWDTMVSPAPLRVPDPAFVVVAHDGLHKITVDFLRVRRQVPFPATYGRSSVPQLDPEPHVGDDVRRRTASSCIMEVLKEKAGCAPAVVDMDLADDGAEGRRTASYEPKPRKSQLQRLVQSTYVDV
ncbi:hypothetical protein C8R43DRAFT_1140378 [Mycena crocata]|nr:hypothetical protein C8R43DRAFT_1140378 [Mycena crocata]